MSFTSAPLAGLRRWLVSSSSSKRGSICWRCALQQQQRRSLQTASSQSPASSTAPDFGFAFDVDGVLVRGSKALPHATRALTYLRQNRIPYILLTNGGGYPEEKRAERLTRELELDEALDPETIVQSHTPFSQMDEFKKGTVLIVGGTRDNCVQVAKKYGFENAITPSDIFAQQPTIWPFSHVFKAYHEETAANNGTPLPRVMDREKPTQGLKVDAIFVYNDPRDWALDTQVIVDCLLSHRGILGTISAKNHDASLPNCGYQQDGQPPLYFSNPDLWFASAWPLPRLGQGGFRAAFEGVWAAVTGGRQNGVELLKTVIGKPYHDTYLYAEKVLNKHSRRLSGDDEAPPLKRVYMIGDNPESDIKGANNYRSPNGSAWPAILVRTGVYARGTPSARPTVTVDNVRDAVNWGVGDSGWGGGLD